MILLPAGGSLFEITSSPLRPFVKVVILGPALCSHGESKKKGETKCKIQSRTWPPVSDLLVYSSIVSFNLLSEIGFIK
jgi:hypothetical protein